MGVKVTNKDLNKWNLEIDPLDGNNLVHKPTSGDTPNEQWDLERLSEYARGSIDLSRSLARKSTVERFRAGNALSIAKTKLKGGKKGAWCRWLKDQNISRTLAWEALKLFERAGSEEAVADLDITRAYRKYGITNPPKRRAASKTQVGVGHTTPETPPHVPEEYEDEEDEGEVDDDVTPAESEDETPPPKEDPSSLARTLSAFGIWVSDAVDGIGDAGLPREERDRICRLAENDVRLLGIFIERVRACRDVSL